MEANGSPKPEFETDEDRSYFITRLFVHEGFSEDIAQNNKNFDHNSERSLSEVLSKVLSEEDYKKVKPIILVMEDKGYITPKEAESVCGKSSATVRRYMTMLKNTGVICMEGNTNNIIYKITENIS